MATATAEKGHASGRREDTCHPGRALKGWEVAMPMSTEISQNIIKTILREKGVEEVKYEGSRN
jgi:hypothetical protein